MLLLDQDYILLHISYLKFYQSTRDPKKDGVGFFVAVSIMHNIATTMNMEWPFRKRANVALHWYLPFVALRIIWVFTILTFPCFIYFPESSAMLLTAFSFFTYGFKIVQAVFAQNVSKIVMSVFLISHVFFSMAFTKSFCRITSPFLRVYFSSVHRSSSIQWHTLV